MNNCGKCVHFGHFYWGFGKCFGGMNYRLNMVRNGCAPTRCFCCRACQDFEPCETAGLLPITLRDAVELTLLAHKVRRQEHKQTSP